MSNDHDHHHGHGHNPPGPMGEEIRRVGYRGPVDVAVRQIATRESLAKLVNRSTAPANSDYYPYVDLHAVRARFKNEVATSFVQ